MIPEIDRQTPEAKCANCGWWQGRDSETTRAAHCDLNEVKTLDLACCSGWREHRILSGQIIEAS